ncbi:hypothetical protein DSL92_05325 [Billgrantia gudaonensis]|uniref:Uncharacterized protein n=1 Tax=Billgrantia gudaonensis TaxID=376427 RepID=A0A432JJ07_9GAMM|nr:hypothetical protein DSL92_05325 [Halomonas gudaonensis]
MTYFRSWAAWWLASLHWAGLLWRGTLWELSRLPGGNAGVVRVADVDRLRGAPSGVVAGALGQAFPACVGITLPGRVIGWLAARRATLPLAVVQPDLSLPAWPNMACNFDHPRATFRLPVDPLLAWLAGRADGGRSAAATRCLALSLRGSLPVGPRGRRVQYT